MSYPMTTMITMTTSLTGKIGTKKKNLFKMCQITDGEHVFTQ